MPTWNNLDLPGKRVSTEDLLRSGWPRLYWCLLIWKELVYCGWHHSLGRGYICFPLLLAVGVVWPEALASVISLQKWSATPFIYCLLLGCFSRTTETNLKYCVIFSFPTVIGFLPHSITERAKGIWISKQTQNEMQSLWGEKHNKYCLVPTLCFSSWIV